ncbi:MAG: M48 family metallopeptidase [Myxococcales bacterium]|nr:M48 family metallopeptidase [Myxococcales bacterium]
MLRALALLAVVVPLLACATSPTGRSQLRLFPDAEMAKMGVAAYDKMKTEMKVSRDATLQRRATCVASAIVSQVSGPHANARWEVTVFDDPSPNAFALPGAKIGVHSGLFQVAKNQDQLATVIGHEVAHVLAEHSNERVSTQYATQTGISMVGAIMGGPSAQQEQILGLLGVGAVILPFSRAQESEADVIGLDLMSRAGFDPAASVALWRNMSAAGGGQPPEFMSTHPSHGRRIQDLEQAVPEARQVQQAARQRGIRPACY